MEQIDQILKQATAFKKSYGYTYALDFLIGQYDASKPDDLSKLLNKIYKYFSHELNYRKVTEFISQLINSKTIEQYSGLLSSYYWMLQDYKSYKLTIMNQISKVNPNNPWQYCFDLKQFQNSLCKYYHAMGLDQEDNAIEFLYNLISATFFDVAGELMRYSNNFTLYYSHLRFGNEFKFYHPDSLIPLSEYVDGWFDDDSDNNSKCLKVMKCEIQKEKVIQIIKQKIFHDFPIQLGFKIDILDKNCTDSASFALSFFNKQDYNDILGLTDKITEWRIQIAGKTVGIATDETNNILKQIYKK